MFPLIAGSVPQKIGPTCGAERLRQGWTTEHDALNDGKAKHDPETPVTPLTPADLDILGAAERAVGGTVSLRGTGAKAMELGAETVVGVDPRLEGLKGIRELQSTASQAVGTVAAELNAGADPREVENDIETEVARITTFPAAAEAPRITQVEPQELAVQFVLHGDITRDALKNLAVRVRDELTDLPGVSQVGISGIPADQIDIEVRRETLRSHGLGLLDLADRLSARNLDLSSGQIDTGASEVQVRTLGEAKTADDFRKIELFSDDNGATVELGDIASVSETRAETAVQATLSGNPAIFVSGRHRAGPLRCLRGTRLSGGGSEGVGLAKPERGAAGTYRPARQERHARRDPDLSLGS
ncbi:hypothetical protein C5748_14185 [Phyllobacterium phragmitis]|uniref:AcrB/AcrD/AcrF family protein n=1 Tax=Phyllobacterium phragmitis TaxID=2670329 RepID=A0A2S9IQW1_9HYPH|nr:efflux RND transporter permease subunit [Phyllobacterium phragmitis]PRD42914.1 hypothetical protein C5748_14185 [Phyllobacterium phragmitis]